MRTVIFFMSKHGTTEKVAEILRQYLKSPDVDIINLKYNTNISLDPYDTIIIGGSIHAGSIQRKITKFIKLNHQTLKQKKLGLYLCCMEKEDICVNEFNKAYPEDLRLTAKATGVLGGEFLLNKMNFIERILTKKAAGITINISKIDRNAIREFATHFTY